MGVPVPAPISDGDRERVAELLQHACGDGRLTLEEFSVRVGDVWAASTEVELAKATEGLAATPVVTSARTVDSVVTVFGERRRVGRWRLRSQRLNTWTVFGSTKLDLRSMTTGEPVVEIAGACVFGELKVFVPEGVEVEVSGASAFSSEQIRLAAVPRVPGTPVIRMHVHAWFCAVEVFSLPPNAPLPD
ncbi:DUF1707 domain-containing protein [Actinoplanes sp. NBRC 101535]|uniref:DUF1707 SHOCT-like domain-containing protein n=1 Tax=Actinoplanes sp. NBRC 101535 TaxID=3032196 RepID=UPI0024A05A15|nr:DUF1707 domain-containing protein [Actinoplanes sp. NBRC 101535]GLY00357.1 hypothetical protein Acsp01_07360 [Actinoplanes sp. NBRC 101535]